MCPQSLDLRVCGVVTHMLFPLLAAAVNVGCDTPQSAQPPRKSPMGTELHSGEPAHSRLASQMHEAGDIIAGQKLVHTFSFANKTASELKLDPSKSIQSSCGCTNVRVTDTRLQSQAETTIVLEILTDGKHGLLEEHATVTWTQKDGTPLATRFSVRARVNAPLTWEPAQIHFTRHDIKHQITKPITCRTDLPLDLLSAGLTTNDEHLRFHERKVDNARRTLTLQISCNGSNSIDAKVAWVRIDAREASKQTRNQKRNTAQDTAHNEDSPDSLSRSPCFSAVLPVYIDDLETLRLAPRFPTLRAEATNDGASWQGHVVVTGTAISEGDSVQAISCSTCEIKISSRPLGTSALRIELAVVPMSSLDAAPVHTAELIMQSGKRLPLRFRLQAAKAEAPA